MKLSLFSTALIAVLLTGSQPLVNAQVLYGTIVGNVTDPSGAPIPAAAVKILNNGTLQEWNIRSNEAGVYSITTVPAGKYDVTVAVTGFQTHLERGVPVAANNTVRVDVGLKVGAVTETIAVSAAATVLQTDSADVRAEIKGAELDSTPVPFTRNYQSLLITVPGVTPPVNAHSAPANPSRSLQVNSNGTNSQSTNFRVDGATTGHPWLPHVAGYVPSMDAIQEVNIVSNSFDAEQGFAGGAAVNVQIKSGTNQIHGSAYDYHLNQHLKARPYFLPADRGKEKRIVNQYGATLGGPVLKNKLFYFVAFEGTPDRQGAFATGSTPTALMKIGDFSESARPIYDPSTGDVDGGNRLPFANNKLPAARISPIAAKLAGLTPSPNIGSGIANNLFVSGPFAFDRSTIDSKVTYNATSRLNLNGRFSYLNWKCDDPAFLGELGGGGIGRCTYDGKSFGHTLSMTYAGVYTISPRLTVDANVGYTLYDARVEPIRLDENLGTGFLGIPGTNTPSNRLLGGWPGFAVSGFRTLGRNNTNAPWFYHSPQAQYVTNASYIRGNHSIRFGYDSMQVSLTGDEPAGFPGLFNFGTGLTGIKGGTADSYNAYAGFLLGLTSSYSKTVTWTPNTARTFAQSLYIRDKWQINRKLTVSLGLRWDYFGVPTREDRGMEVYDFTNNTLKLCGYSGTQCDITMSKKNFAPRLGIAYRLSEGFVMRAGYGIAYDPVNIARNPLHSYPLQTALSVTAANGFAAASQLKDGITSFAAPDLKSGVITVPGNVTMELFDPHFRRAYVQSYNVMLQKEFKGWVAEGGYAANGTRHMQNRWNSNYGSIGGGAASRVLNQRFGRAADTNFSSDTGGFNSSYNSLQSSVVRRYKSGYFTKFTYTLSKAIGPNGNGTGVDGYSMANPAYFKLNKALQAYDRTHMFTGSWGGPLPFGAGQRFANTGWSKHLLSGWQWNGLFAAYTGTPFSVSADGTSLNAPGNAQLADQVKANVQILGTRDSWFDPLAFVPVTEARFGISGFNILRAPGSINFDSSFFRTFKFGERFSLQFKAEAFNLTNTPHFGGPGTNVSSLQKNVDGTIRNLNGFTVINGVQNNGREGVDERMFRFALRLSF